MHKKGLLLILLFHLLAFGLQPSFAKSHEDPLRPPVDLETISLDEAVSIALENSYTLRESEDEIKRIKNRRGEETLWNWLRPNVSLRGGWNTEENVPDVSVGASVDLRDIMGAGKKRISNLELDMRLAEAKKNKIRSSIVNNIKRLYRDYQLAKEKVKLMEEMVAQSDELKGILEKGIKEGKARTETILVIAFTLNQSRMNLISARQDLTKAEMQLLEAMNIE
ncbi:MAG: TolC family protein [Nitrospirota bacterium]